jgi:uncharacterized protein YndB with AHSA1/START domain
MVMSEQVAVSRTIAASADAVWDAIAHVTRMGEWSTECHTCEWDDGASGPSVGAAFTGHNRHGDAEWTSQATITDCVRGERFSFEVRLTGPTAEMFGDGVFSTWTYTIEPAGDGCMITEATEDHRSDDLIAASKVFLSDIPDRAAHNRGTMTTTLERLAAAVE